ncbi:MAG: serine/threonine protein kinase [Sandaracinus sp.]|nr:serine/threonine protein kinase [Sandaracinus sp.]
MSPSEPPGAELPVVGARLMLRYRLDGLLARGGVGAVYRGFDVDTDRPVAVKVLPRSLDHGAKRERFLREAKLAASVGHPHVVKVLDAGFYDEGRPFLVMELLEGTSLHKRIQTFGPLRVADACSLASQLCSAAEAVHSCGIIHRDIKPANVLVMRALGITVKLIDFGMSKSLLDDNHLTEPGRVMGTPSYLAPEVLLGKPADVRADIYGIGATVYEALVGVPWVKNHSRIEQTLHAVLTKQPEPPSALRPKVPDYVDALVLQACARDPNQRFSDAAEFKRAADDAMNRVVREEIDAP